ncbi:MAG TPA: tripartite tricarboxylate transporter substrate-binding protein [Burkholderiales bacterium]|nr:tripartite tricarboxylate transporter substrate-binding protein [Burkholderiales bacterium]
MKLSRGILFAVLFGCVLAAGAQSYPVRPITLVVPFSAGGPTDTIARIMAARMTVAIGQTVVVDNTTGAGGSIGVGRVVKSAPDGYTIGIGHIGTHVVNGAIYPLTYDLLTDLEPVAMIATNPQILVAKNAIPAKNLKEFLVWEKANQDKASVGTGGAGTPGHVSAVYFQNVTGTKPQIIHYRGAAPAMQDLLSGQIDFMFDQAANSLPQVRAGRVHALAVTAKTRLTAAPDIPTVDEAGLPNFYMAVWHGIWAPKGTPQPIINKINAAIVEALADPAVRAKLADLGQEIPPREQQTPEALRAHHKAEIEKWWPIVKQAGIKVE